MNRFPDVTPYEPNLCIPVTTFRVLAAGTGKHDSVNEGVLVAVHAVATLRSISAAEGGTTQFVVPAFAITPLLTGDIDPALIGLAWDSLGERPVWGDVAAKALTVRAHPLVIAADASHDVAGMLANLKYLGADLANSIDEARKGSKRITRVRAAWLTAPWFSAAGAYHCADFDNRLLLADLDAELAASLAARYAEESGGVWPPAAGKPNSITANETTRVIHALRQSRPGASRGLTARFALALTTGRPGKSLKDVEREHAAADEFRNALTDEITTPVLLPERNEAWHTPITVLDGPERVARLLANWLVDDATIRRLCAICGRGLSGAQPAICDGKLIHFPAFRFHLCALVRVTLPYGHSGLTFTDPDGAAQHLVPGTSLRWLTRSTLAHLEFLKREYPGLINTIPMVAARKPLTGADETHMAAAADEP